VIFPESDNY